MDEDRVDARAPAFDRRVARRFLQACAGYWTGPTSRTAWMFTLGIAGALVLRLCVDVAANRWNRWFFDALEKRDATSAALAVAAFAVLVAAIAAVGVLIVRLRESFQVRWREWWTARLLDGWLTRSRLVGLAAPDAAVAHPEYRISDDVRMATEPLVDFAMGLFTAILGALTFVGILWSVGGSLHIAWGGSVLTIPAFMVVGAILYGVLASCLIPLVGRRLAGAAAARNESEARFRAEMIRLRENAERIGLSAGEGHARASLGATYAGLVRHWLALVREHGHVTWVMNANTALVPVVPLVLAAPKYMQGELTLGEVMQLASAFVQVQTAIGWLVDNFSRVAEWFASARRVSELGDAMEGCGPERAGVSIGVSPDRRFHLEGLRLTDQAGRAVVARADAVIAPGERVAVLGRPGAGKSILLRALAGLWPWGTGRVLVPAGARIMFLPPDPYLPTGSLAEAILFPDAPDSVPPSALAAALERCGLLHLSTRAAEVQRWQHVLSSDERQRIGLARLILRPADIVVIEEPGGGLDDALVEIVEALLARELAQAMVLTIGQRSALARAADRCLTLRPTPEGALLEEEARPLAPAAALSGSVIALKPPRRELR